MKKIVFFIVILITFCSCDKLSQVEYGQIPTWKNPNLQNNDIVCFANQQDNNLIDTFIITRHDDEFVHDRANIWERINLSYKNINKQSDLRQIDVYLAGKNDFYIYHYTTSDGYATFDIEINGINHSVFELENEAPTTNKLPDNLYYSYKEGILRYCFSNVIYNRIK